MNFAQSRPSTAQYRLRVAVLAVSCMRWAEAKYAAVAQVSDVDAIESMQAQASCDR